MECDSSWLVQQLLPVKLISAFSSSSFALLIDQFWQNLQPKLQPAVPKLRIVEPGRKWLSGFFSIGSIAKPVGLP
ncbi:MAG: hypothetical protein MZV64_41225 [Ignavibacteriales bacterium]|nr:hypothetical protein [Ignavibacteriales bacterium]